MSFSPVQRTEPCDNMISGLIIPVAEENVLLLLLITLIEVYRSIHCHLHLFDPFSSHAAVQVLTLSFTIAE